MFSATVLTRSRRLSVFLLMLTLGMVAALTVVPTNSAQAEIVPAVGPFEPTATGFCNQDGSFVGGRFWTEAFLDNNLSVTFTTPTGVYTANKGTGLSGASPINYKFKPGYPTDGMQFTAQVFYGGQLLHVGNNPSLNTFTVTVSGNTCPGSVPGGNPPPTTPPPTLPPVTSPPPTTAPPTTAPPTTEVPPTTAPPTTAPTSTVPPTTTVTTRPTTTTTQPAPPTTVTPTTVKPDPTTTVPTKPPCKATDIKSSHWLSDDQMTLHYKVENSGAACVVSSNVYVITEYPVRLPQTRADQQVITLPKGELVVDQALEPCVYNQTDLIVGTDAPLVLVNSYFHPKGTYVDGRDVDNREVGCPPPCETPTTTRPTPPTTTVTTTAPPTTHQVTTTTAPPPLPQLVPETTTKQEIIPLVPPPPKTPPEPPIVAVHEELPVTGTDISGLLPIAFVLGFSGFLLLVVSRQRRLHAAAVKH